MSALINREFTRFRRLYRGDLFLVGCDLYVKLDDTTTIRAGSHIDRYFASDEAVMRVYYHYGRLR